MKVVKVKLTRTMIKIYELNPEYYPEGLTYEQMIEMDINPDNREMLFENDLISDEVAWELIDE